MKSPESRRYEGRRFTLLTQHGKEKVIARELEVLLGCRVERTEGYDTDLLGTFTREVPRPGTQLDAARRKARIGMEISGSSLGLGSEGAFGPHPIGGFVSWNVEILVFIDDELGLEAVGRSEGPANFSQRVLADWAEAEAFAHQAGFPLHQLVVRPESGDDPRMRKGISDWTELEAAFAWAKNQSSSGRLYMENDVRAHTNPTRMEIIRLAAGDLAARLSSSCPACGLPGFAFIERIPGLPCNGCGAPTRLTRAEVNGCLKCPHRETHVLRLQSFADPGCCDFCNP